ncbi:MAG: VTT domain-containing protein [Opitutus sp.]
MSVEASVPARKLPLLKLAAFAIVLAVLAGLSLRGVDLRGLAEQGMALIRQAGPAAFFGAMVILPAFGAPLAAFTIPAGEAFEAQLGIATVIALSLAAIAINLVIGYAVARFALRPPLLALLTRLGYAIPRITPENALSVLLVVRFTPGPPYVVQTYILGVAQAPFRLYMIVSWLAVLPWAIGGIILGKGLFNGNFAVVVMGLGVLVVAGVLWQWLRTKLARRED